MIGYPDVEKDESYVPFLIMVIFCHSFYTSTQSHTDPFQPQLYQTRPHHFSNLLFLFLCHDVFLSPVDLLGGGAPLGLPYHLSAAPPQCSPRLWQPSPQGV